MIDLTGKSWADKTSRDMTIDELDDAITTYRATGDPLDRNCALGYEAEWEIRLGISNLSY